MSKKNGDVDDVKKNLKSMSWDELASNLIDLEIEFFESKESLKKDQLDAFNLLILLYEEEKQSRINRTTDFNKFLEDEKFIAYDWTEDLPDD